MVELNEVKDTVETFETLERGVSDVNDFLELLDVDEFLHEKGELEKSVRRLRKQVNVLRTKTLLSGEYDKNDAILSVHAGAGGTEATDWASMLERMYERYLERKNFKFEILDKNEEDEGGIKSVTLSVKGYNAYGLLKSEKGVHRLVRISPFDANKRRHTSFASVDIYPQLDDDVEVEINPSDLRIDTFRATGAGGQHVNTTDSAVRITHLPTGVTVTCRNERSQIQNRATAMGMLKAKLIQIKEEEHREKIEDIQGKYSQISWGNQIRSYVFQPYTKVKDHRTDYEVGNVEAVMDGDIDDFIEAYLNWKAQDGNEKE